MLAIVPRATGSLGSICNVARSICSASSGRPASSVHLPALAIALVRERYEGSCRALSNHGSDSAARPLVHSQVP